MDALTPRYVVAWRPRGAGNAWHVVDRLTGDTMSRHPDRAGARSAALTVALETAAAALRERSARHG